MPGRYPRRLESASFMTAQTSDKLPLLSRFLMRLLDRTKTIDYVIAFLFGVWPCVLARILGVHDTVEGYRGYWHSPNFVSLSIILPGLLWMLRWAMSRIAPVCEAWPPSSVPPLIELLDTQEGKKTVYEELRRVLLSPRIVIVALITVLLIHVLDLRQMLVEQYLHRTPAKEVDRDWASMFLLEPSFITQGKNFVFVIFAFSVQFAVVLLAMFFGALIIAHNFFFLRHIYQRRWVPDGQEEYYFQIDLADGDRCFGFRDANDAFNTQIMFLMVGGFAMLVSRFAHTVTWDQLRHDPNLILPNVGQVMMSLGWVVAFVVISLPALVKLLPRLPIGGSDRASRTVTNYLREFMAPDRWPFGREPSHDEIGALAARFASNAFWPTGNNRASQLFFFSIWIGLVVVFTPPTDQPLYFFASLVVMGVVAYFGQKLIFALMGASLRFVDDRLVDPPDGPMPSLILPGRKLEAGVFISYRRADTAAYTGRLYDYLTDHFHSDRIFMDVEGIGAGERFSTALDSALASSAAVIVMIGPRWVSIEGSDGKRRLDDPADWVRIEVSTSLKRDIKVFPVLVGGASLPAARELPDCLVDLIGRNSRELSDTRWDYDAKELMRHVRAALDESRRRD